MISLASVIVSWRLEMLALGCALAGDGADWGLKGMRGAEDEELEEGGEGPNCLVEEGRRGSEEG